LYARTLKHIQPLSLDDKNPSQHNIAHLAAVRKGIDDSFALKLETAAAQLPMLLIQAATSLALAKSVPKGQSTTLLVILAPILQTIPARIQAQLFPGNSRQAILWRRVHDTLVKNSAALLHELPKENQEEAEKIDSTIKIALTELCGDETPTTEIDSFKKLYEALIIRQAHVLGQPRRIQNYLSTFDRQALNAFLEGKSKEQRLLYSAIIFTIMAQSALPEIHTTRLQILLWGRPGVGKDTIIQQICEILGTRKHDITIEDMRVRRQMSYGSQPTKAAHQPTTGPEVKTDDAIADVLSHAGYKNAVLYLPEFAVAHKKEPYLMSQMLTALDPADEPLAPILFASSNYKPAAALANRFICIHVPSPTPAQRQANAERKFDGIFGRTAQILSGGSQNRTLRHDSEEARRFKAEIIEWLADNSDSGYRQSNRNIMFLHGYIFGKFLLGETLEEDDIKELLFYLDKTDSDDDSEDEENDDESE